MEDNRDFKHLAPENVSKLLAELKKLLPDSATVSATIFNSRQV